MLLGGFGILILSFVTGICISFIQWDRGSPFDVSRWDNFNPVGRATYAPFVFAVICFPFTLPLLLFLSLPVYFGLKKQTRWPLAVLGFVAMGIFWLLWVTELWQMD
jgi:hypothetical protein